MITILNPSIILAIIVITTPVVYIAMQFEKAENMFIAVISGFLMILKAGWGYYSIFDLGLILVTPGSGLILSQSFFTAEHIINPRYNTTQKTNRL